MTVDAGSHGFHTASKAGGDESCPVMPQKYKWQRNQTMSPDRK